MAAYYNEIDEYAAKWLRNLMDAGHIPAGDIDTRSIEDVRPDELRGYTQCHFFAGIGGWAYALRLAGWPDDRPVWTGSCPCQPFSAAGKGAGFADERHLWPAWHHLISQCRPAIIFGEQVASAAVGPWLDLVQADLEGVGYAFGSVAFPAAGVGAPHIRDRNYWMADASSEGLAQRVGNGRVQREALVACTGQAAISGGYVGRLADTNGERLHGEYAPVRDGQGGDAETAGGGEAPDGSGTPGRGRGERVCEVSVLAPAHGIRPGPVNGFWRDADWLLCRDGKWRPVEPGTQQMVDGLSRGMGRLRADHDCQEEIANATKAIGLSDQVLRALRGGHEPTAIWRSLGGRLGFPEATLLLASLCEQSGELGRIFRGSASRGAKAPEGSMREVRNEPPSTARSSSGRGYPQQLAWELGNALPELPQALPRSREHVKALRSFTGMPLAHGISNRVGRLRAYGNAIVPQEAAEFIGAVGDVLRPGGRGTAVIDLEVDALVG